MKSTIIRLDRIKKKYDDHLVLDNISFDIYDGELFGIIGGSGSGKTTLLNTIVGFLHPDSGEVYFRNKNIQDPGNSQLRSVVTNSKEVKKRFGVAAQTPSFYNRLTVFENLDFFGSLYGLGREARLTNINTLLELVQLENARDIKGGNLSGGMQRRLDIACALIHDPDVLILDEPTSDLDPRLSKHIWNLLQRINRRGTTIIVASHDLIEIEAISTRVGVLFNGKMDHIGTIHELTRKFSRGQEIRFESFPGNYKQILEKVKGEGVSEVEIQGNKLVIRTEKPDKILSRLLRELNNSEETLMDLTLGRLNLTEIFTKISKK